MFYEISYRAIGMRERDKYSKFQVLENCGFKPFTNPLYYL
jgi:hypothetical protein